MRHAVPPIPFAIACVFFALTLPGFAVPLPAATRSSTSAIAVGPADPRTEVRGTMYETIDADQTRAEEIFASAEAAIYFPSLRRVRWLSSSGGVAAAAKSAAAGTRTLGEFTDEIERDFPRFRSNVHGPYLLKQPSVMIGNPGALAETVSAAPLAGVFTDSFESGMTNWSITNNTADLYSWGPTGCEARTGTYSADAMRGGTNTLGCSDAYAANVTTMMVHKSCEAIQGASQAWLDAYIRLGTESGTDKLGFYYADPNGQGYGYEFTGTASAWYHLVFNLKQWYRVGDLTSASCPRLGIQFYSNATTQSGIGARVDDITIGNATPAFLTASITATPSNGTVPLTVNFASTVAGATSPTYQWSFDDAAGTTATTPTASFTYATAGDYWPRLIVTDSGVRAAANALIHATAASVCSVTCTATAPSTVAAGSSALFQATVTATGCSGTASYSWTFGDGQSSVTQNASHTYAAAGTYNWTLTASISGTTCTKSGSITVTTPTTGSTGVRRRAVPPPTGTEQLASTTIGTSGGTLSGGGFTMTVPAGAFGSATTLSLTRTSTIATGDLSDTFAVQGLPNSLAADLSIKVELNSSPPTLASDEKIYVSFGGLAMGRAAAVKSVPFLLPATVAGRVVTATLSKSWASPSLANAATRQVSTLDMGRDSARYDSKVVKMAVVENDHFTVTSNVPDKGWAYAALTTLEEANQRLGALGFNWGCRQPAGGAFVKFPVYVQSLGTGEKSAYGEHHSRLDPCGTGLVFTDFMYLNKDCEVSSDAIRAAIGHELFHAVQETYFPTMALDPVHVLWIKEASSTWFETIFVPGSCPGVMSANFQFAWRGLFNSRETAADGERVAAKAQNHGYGAAAVLKYRTDASGVSNDPFVNSLWNGLKAGNSELESLQNALGSSVPEFWMKFSRDYFEGKATCSTYQNFSKSVEIKDASSLPKSFQFSAYPLSSISYGFDMKSVSITGLPLQLTAGGLTDRQTVFIYSTKSKSEIGQLTKAASTYSIPDVSVLQGGYIVLTFVDTNYAAGSFASTNDVTLALTPAVSYWTVRAPYDDTKCDIVAWANGTAIWYPASFFFAKWTGNSFEYTESGTEAKPYGTTLTRETIVRGAVSADKKMLDSFTVEYHSNQVFPTSDQCKGTCYFETWASVAVGSVTAAADWAPQYLHYKVEGVAARPLITKYLYRVRTSGWPDSRDNWDCTVEIEGPPSEDTKIEVALY